VVQQKAPSANTPVGLSWAPAASPTPRPGPAAWAVNDKDRFDQGWDQLHLETLAGQKQIVVVPPLSPHTLRSSKIQAGFLADADDHLGARVAGLADLEILETTLGVPIPGGAGGSGESSLQGTFDQITAQQGLGPLITAADDNGSELIGKGRALATDRRERGWRPPCSSDHRPAAAEARHGAPQSSAPRRRPGVEACSGQPGLPAIATTGQQLGQHRIRSLQARQDQAGIGLGQFAIGPPLQAGATKAWFDRVGGGGLAQSPVRGVGHG
jgi:hypothetical protein